MTAVDPLLAEALERFEADLGHALTTGRRNLRAMALATVTANGRPAVRNVLLRGFGPDGFRFFTDRRSEKAQELLARPVASGVLYWEPVEEQVRIDGRVVELDRDDVDADFAARARDAQLLLHGPAQSAPVRDRDVLVRARDEAAARFPDEVPTPDTWTGFRLVPDRIEFWCGARDRLHDRRRYATGADGVWSVSALAP